MLISNTSTQALQPTGGDTTAEGPDRLRAAAQAFESVFLQELMKSGRAAQLGEDILGSSAADTHRSLLDMQLADSASRRTDFGIAQAVYDQFAGHVPGTRRGG
ncbi:rod-binding protein [Meridianimarinicoccus sp. RP-17]|uniref:rod-binding protein n=1 Tax=Meridianimarinicoccus zhengii TaxID=2056810 RepID=UPI000DAB7C55|nr:rod-binding protein [Phycocomes zhengii]